MVEQNQDCYGLNRCLEALRVAKSSWHYRQNGYGRPWAKEEEMEREMRQILEDHPDYGRPRMTVELRERLGYRINHKRVERLLRQNGWGIDPSYSEAKQERRSTNSSSQEGELG